MREIIQREKPQDWLKGPWPVKRPWGGEVLGLPDSGKTTLFKEMLPPLLGIAGIKFRRFSQDEGAVGRLHQGLLECLAGIRASPVNQQEDVPELHEMVSAVYLTMLKLNAIEIKHHMVHEMYLWEHGPYFTWIVEHFWGKVSFDRLREEFSCVPKPDFGIFFELTPEQILEERGLRCSRMLWNPKVARKIYETMEEVARVEDWPKIKARQSRDAIARIAEGEIRRRWNIFLKTDQVGPPPFKFPFEL